MFEYRSLDKLSTEESSLVQSCYIKETQCLHCSQLYIEANNIGRQCCRLHPGIIVVNDNVQRYSCCQKLANHKGCQLSDHISSHEIISIDNSEEREEKLKEMASIIIPTDYFRFGIRPPLQRNIVYHHRKGTKINPRESIKIYMHFNRKLLIQYIPEREHRQLKREYLKSPILSLMDADNLQQYDATQKIEKNWLNSLYDDQTEIDEERDLENQEKIDIPFIICRRM